jgi:hypothetical protein
MAQKTKHNAAQHHNQVRKETPMNARLFQARHPGQSIPLIALLIVVLFGLVALSVDVGNTYAQNRNAVRATNAAALAGMDKLIHNGGDTEIAAAIKASFQSNGITAQMSPELGVGSDERRIYAWYLDAGGNQLVRCQIGKCPGVPSNVAYIQLQTEGTVDTYFARIVGRPTLPVKAQAFAAQCSPVKGVYPIAVNAADLDENGFVPPSDPDEAKYYGKYLDPQYPLGLTQRRIYRKANFGTPGSFSWLQWRPEPNAGSAQSTLDMLSGDGNLDIAKFKEVEPWPLGPGQAPAPAGYPLLPGQLSEGDWIYGNTGMSNSGGSSGSQDSVTGALEYHMTHRTILNLPIIDQTAGPGGQNTYFHVQRMGAFYLVGYGGAGASAYFDLVYIGEADKTACLNTNVNLGLKGLGIAGQVYLNPRWLNNAAPHQPIAYQMVLDVSGSMSWDFNGYGTYNGRNVQCESSANPNPDGLAYTDKCDGGQNAPWHNVDDRRITIAKRAIGEFIDGMGPDDMMRVIAFTSDSSGHAKLTGYQQGWVLGTNKAKLKDVVSQAGRYNNEEYRTDGGTAGPDALYKASELFKESNGYTPQAPNGQDYKPVVIYLTDGVANIFLKGGPNYAEDIPSCRDLGRAQALNTADPCQVGHTASGTSRPIQAMIDVAADMKADVESLSIFTIGLAQTTQTGLRAIATEPANFFPADEGFKVADVLSQIQHKVEDTTCLAGGGYSWINSIDGAHTPAPMPAPGVYGYVRIFEPGKTTPKHVLPIEHDTSITNNGQLGFSIPPPDPNNPSSVGVTPGIYDMDAYVLYKGNDGATRSYDRFYNPDSTQLTPRRTFTVSPAATIGSSVALAPIFMDLKDGASICPPVAP